MPDQVRFPFGKNWKSFIDVLDERRIDEATRAVTAFLGRSQMAKQRVLDVGSGSGLSSLVFHRLGSTVVSFDYDPDSVACTRLLRDRHGSDGPAWDVLQGSVLDAEFLEGLGSFDLVYAWGVLHHTGSMWRALELTSRCVAPGGELFVALYNDQGWRSRGWRAIKRCYCSGPIGRALVSGTMIPVLTLASFVSDVMRLRPPGHYLRNYASHRGMSAYHDWHDWLGGYPFEVASPTAVVEVAAQLGFTLARSRATRGWGCSEFLFTRKEHVNES